MPMNNPSMKPSGRSFSPMSPEAIASSASPTVIAATAVQSAVVSRSWISATASSAVTARLPAIPAWAR